MADNLSFALFGKLPKLSDDLYFVWRQNIPKIITLLLREWIYSFYSPALCRCCRRKEKTFYFFRDYEWLLWVIIRMIIYY